METYIYNIKVCIRIRPVIKRELNNNSFIQCIASKENNFQRQLPATARKIGKSRPQLVANRIATEAEYTPMA